MTELKPCPFCGGEAEVRHSVTCGYDSYWVECKDFQNCRGSVSPVTDVESIAAAAWNTRHVETDALREACRELVAYAGTCPFDAKDTDTANWSERCDRECSTDVDMAACWMRYFMEVEQ